jgi:predicted nucleotidyltransferase
MDFDLRAHTILLTVSGSRAYGVHRPDSDVDLRGVAIPPASYLHGFLRRFEQADDPGAMAQFEDVLSVAERKATAGTKLEGTVYSLVKFARLAVDCNPNILDVLFCRDEEVRLSTALGDRLRSARPQFLSAKARHTYSGYAMSQLKRIEGHRKWLLDPPTRPPTRAEFQLPEVSVMPADQRAAAAAAIRKQIDRWEIDYGDLAPSQVVALQERMADVLTDKSIGADEVWRGAARTIGLDENLIEVMDRERRYKAAHRHFTQYQTWKRQRNPARAALEAAHGYDTKHAAHLMRLLRMGREIVATGEVHVWRGDIDADELRAVRDGAWSYAELIERARAELDALEAIDVVAVPKKADRVGLDALVVSLVEAALG